MRITKRLNRAAIRVNAGAAFALTRSLIEQECWFECYPAPFDNVRIVTRNEPRPLDVLDQTARDGYFDPNVPDEVTG